MHAYRLDRTYTSRKAKSRPASTHITHIGCVSESCLHVVPPNAGREVVVHLARIVIVLVSVVA